jgi:hypothetical protein
VPFDGTISFLAHVSAESSAKEPQSPLKHIFRTERCQEGVSTADLCRQIDQLAYLPIESVD